MNAHSRTPEAPTPWMVTCWPECCADTSILSVHATREEAVAEAARHPGAMLLFCAAPPPTPTPEEF